MTSDIVIKLKIYHLIRGTLEDEDNTQCHLNCSHKDYVALGNQSGLEYTGKHDVAAKTRRVR